MKKLLLGSLILLGLAILFIVVEAFRTRETILPLPYFFTGQLSQDEITNAEAANVLILGDKNAEMLTPYLKSYKEKLSTNLKNEIKIFNWGVPHEGLHRTLKKLHSLKKVPQLVIYFGGSEEFYEKRASDEERSKIFENFSRYNNDFILTALQIAPSLSKLVYKPLTYIELPVSEIRSNQDSVTGTVSMNMLEIIYALYQLELDELISVAREKHSTLLVITPPINLELSPSASCAESTTQTIESIQNEINILIDSGDFKASYVKSKELLSITYSNAKTWFLFGISALKSGSTNEAKDALLKASAFDCGQRKGNAVINSLIKSSTSKFSIPLIDFDQLLNSDIGTNELFLQPDLPQTIYFEQLMEQLTSRSKELLKI